MAMDSPIFYKHRGLPQAQLPTYTYYTEQLEVTTPDVSLTQSNLTLTSVPVVPPSSTWWHWLHVITISVISVAIITSNILNLLVLRHVHQMAQATRIFLINLSVSDLCVGLIACAPAVYPSIVGGWVYGAVFCQISGIIHGTSVTISIWSISMVGVERFIATTRPFKYQSWVTPSRCLIIVVAMWSASIITFIAPNLTTADFLYYEYNEDQKICGLHWRYRLFCVVTGLYIPVLAGGVLVYTSIHINRALTIQREFRAPQTRIKDVRYSLSKRTFHILLATSLAYFCCWTPYVTMVIIMALLPVNPPQWFQFLSMWAANSNSAINVLIYSCTNRHFRQAAQYLLCHVMLQKHVVPSPDQALTTNSCSNVEPANDMPYLTQNGHLLLPLHEEEAAFSEPLPV